MKHMVAGFLFDESRERVVLIEKQKPEWQAGRLNAIGGKVEPGETIDNAMRREFLEETGVDVLTWRPFCFLHHTAYNWGVHFFEATGPVEYIVQTEQEIPSVHSVHALPAKIIPNLRWLVMLGRDPDGLVADIADPNG